jgi:hypothetical protein
MTPNEIIEMVGRARRVNMEFVGRNDKAVICEISPEFAIAQAEVISGSGLTLEFGRTQSLRDILYITGRVA